MIGTKRFLWYPCAVALAILVAAGAARADFVLSGSEHLNITSSHSTGVLWDSSTADVLAGGSIGNAYVNNEATLRIPKFGGGAHNVYAYDTSNLDLSGSSVHTLCAYSTSAVAISGTNVDYLYVYENSSVDITGGYNTSLEAYDTSSVAVSGGTVNYPSTHNASALAISGGSFSSVDARDTSTIDIFGGSLSNLRAFDTSKVTLHGYDFRTTAGLALNGDTVLGTGVLTGKWFDGTPWALTVNTHASGATILAVPEPATLFLLALGGLALLRLRRR